MHPEVLPEVLQRHLVLAQASQGLQGEVLVWEDQLLELAGLRRQAGSPDFRAQGFLGAHHLDFRGEEGHRLDSQVLRRDSNQRQDSSHRLVSNLHQEDEDSHRQGSKVGGDEFF